LVEQLLDQEKPVIPDERLFGLIVPHAGYAYSGATAAYGYRLVRNQPVNTVFVLAPSHAEWFAGVSVYGGDYYATPLGRVAINKQKAASLCKQHELIKLSNSGHLAHGDRSEHSLEVQLPFLQVALADAFQLVAIVFHDYSAVVCGALGAVLTEVMEEGDLLVASTDLYHGYSYSGCNRADDATLRSIQSFELDAFCGAVQQETVQACGAGPVAALLQAAHLQKADIIRLLHRTNSADVTATRSGWTVGYACLSVSKCRRV